MKDLKKLAEALGVNADDRAVAPLVALEKVFRPMAERLGPADDIAVVLEREDEA